MRIPPLTTDSLRLLQGVATVPEHSAVFMQAMSGGTAFLERGFLFLAADDWLMGVGYPFASPGETSSESHRLGQNETRFAEALDAALERTGATACYAVAPALPARLDPFAENRDVFYTLAAEAPVPAALRGPVSHAAARLEVREDREFTPAHRRLWAEFLGRAIMRPNVRGLYARTEAALRASRTSAANGLQPLPDLRLLSAFDAAGNLAASLLLDYSPGQFCAYIIGAHSKRHYVPHATDLLFAAMLEHCRAEGKRFVHLGLGVNDGITRFKKKWGGRPVLPFVMASWKEKPRQAKGFADYAPVLWANASPALACADSVLSKPIEPYVGSAHTRQGLPSLDPANGGNTSSEASMASSASNAATPLALAVEGWEEGHGAGKTGRGAPLAPFLAGEAAGLARCLLDAPPGASKQQIFDSFPEQRRFGMIFELRKGDALSYLCGSAHFFRYSFEMDFRGLFAPLDAVVFEGPLDEDFLAAVETSGRSPDQGDPRIADVLDEAGIAVLERAVYGPEGPLARLLGRQQPRRLDLRGLIRAARPWFAFFSIWVAYLERHGWQQSVDLEAWRTARDMGVPVIAMENLEEQLASLQSVPLPRIADFFRRCGEWPAYMKRNIRTYLAGDLQGMMGSSIEFPSRTEQVIDRRDQRFRERMRPFIEAGNCAVFVGTAHLVGLIPMLEADGFSIRRLERGMRGKLRRAFGGRDAL